MPIGSRGEPTFEVNHDISDRKKNTSRGFRSMLGAFISILKTTLCQSEGAEWCQKLPKMTPGLKFLGSRRMLAYSSNKAQKGLFERKCF
jgi:hypothetical protein